VGYVEKEEKMALIDRSSCFILPSYTESFSISIVEAMARNIPVVTTKGTPWQEINKYKCGYWVENNQKSIQKGLEMFLDLSKVEQQMMGNRAKKMVYDNYILEDNMNKYEELYKYIFNKTINKPTFIY